MKKDKIHITPAMLRANEKGHYLRGMRAGILLCILLTLLINLIV